MFIKSKCKTIDIENNKVAQAEFFTMCEGLRTLKQRLNIHSANNKFIVEVLKDYCSDISFNFINNSNSICLTAKPKPEFCEIIKEKLLPITFYKQERLYSMYSCTAVFIEDDIIYIKAGTEPVKYLKQLFKTSGE